MALPTTPVTLTVEQIDHLNAQLSTMRHDINNQLSLIVAASELIRMNPAMVRKMSATLMEQPPKISEGMARFTAEFVKLLGITRP